MQELHQRVVTCSHPGRAAAGVHASGFPFISLLPVVTACCCFLFMNTKVDAQGTHPLGCSVAYKREVGCWKETVTSCLHLPTRKFVAPLLAPWNASPKIQQHRRLPHMGWHICPEQNHLLHEGRPPCPWPPLQLHRCSRLRQTQCLGHDTTFTPCHACLSKHSAGDATQQIRPSPTQAHARANTRKQILALRNACRPAPLPLCLRPPCGVDQQGVHLLHGRVNRRVDQVQRIRPQPPDTSLWGHYMWLVAVCLLADLQLVRARTKRVCTCVPGPPCVAGCRLPPCRSAAHVCRDRAHMHVCDGTTCPPLPTETQAAFAGAAGCFCRLPLRAGPPWQASTLGQQSSDHTISLAV